MENLRNVVVLKNFKQNGRIRKDINRLAQNGDYSGILGYGVEELGVFELYLKISASPRGCQNSPHLF
jgi:hypothetical protein